MNSMFAPARRLMIYELCILAVALQSLYIGSAIGRSTLMFAAFFGFFYALGYSINFEWPSRPGHKTWLEPFLWVLLVILGVTVSRVAVSFLLMRT